MISADLGRTSKKELAPALKSGTVLDCYNHFHQHDSHGLHSESVLRTVSYYHKTGSGSQTCFQQRTLLR